MKISSTFADKSMSVTLIFPMHKSKNISALSSAIPIIENRESTQDIIKIDNRILRIVYNSDFLRNLFVQHSVKKLIENKDLVAFKVLSKEEASCELKQLWSYLREHDKNTITVLTQGEPPLRNKALDWTSSMWIEAARLLLRISLEILEDGLELNLINTNDIEFTNTKPYLVNPVRIRTINFASFEWEANKDFKNRFINPIIRFLEIGIPFQQSLLYEHGVEPEDLFKEAGWVRSLSPRLFTAALVPSILNAKIKKKGLFSFFSEPTKEEVKEYRKYLYNGLQNELDKLQESNITKSRIKESDPLPYSKEAETWIKEKINFYHPNTFLEVNCNNTNLTKYASEIGISCVSLQNEESLCDKLYRESRKLQLNNLCLNRKMTNMSGLSFDMVLLNKAEYQSATLQTYSKKDFHTILENMTSQYLIVESDEKNWGENFDLIESSYGFSLLKKSLHTTNVV